jgi:hypothetical protein
MVQMNAQHQIARRLDNRGSLIAVWDYCVYNRSGYLAHGQVTSIRPHRGRGWWKDWYIIQNSETGEESKVKDPRSIMVIYED